MIKAKFKIEDTVRESLCLGEAARNQCRDINQQAFLTALELASQVSRYKYKLKLKVNLMYSGSKRQIP